MTDKLPIQPGNDPACRQAWHPLHVCCLADGQPLGPDSVCWYESRARVRDEAAAQRVAK